MVGAVAEAGIVMVMAAWGGGGTGENIGWAAGGDDVTLTDDDGH